MTRMGTTDSELVQLLRTVALVYPGAEEGIACKGTALESSAFKVGNRTFLFMNRDYVRVKLRESLAEALQLESKERGRCEVGASGWVKVNFGNEKTLPLDLLKRWVNERYRVVVRSGSSP